MMYYYLEAVWCYNKWRHLIEQHSDWWILDHPSDRSVYKRN